MIIIKQDKDDSEDKEFRKLEEAIAELEKDPNVSADKIEKIKSTLVTMKNRTKIKIKNGEIIQ